MVSDKYFLTYNQQMKKLRNDKQIDCHDTEHKEILVRAGYFNLIMDINYHLLVEL